MPNERVIFAHEQSPEQTVRIVVSGEMDAAMVEVLKAFAEFQAKIIPKKTAPERKPSENSE